MKLYEAIEKIVNEFGKDIVTNIKAINVFSDYNAFEESKTFKIIVKNLINEGYMDQMMFVRDWSVTEPTLIANFVAATSFNADNASYVIKSVAYGLGHTKVQPIYQPTVGGQAAPAPQAKAAPSYNGMLLDKTPSQIERLGEAARRKYKEAAEAYLESVIEFKRDFAKDLGVTLNASILFDDNADIWPQLEINGKI